MKKFRKILSYFILFFAFCLICIGIVKADTIISSQQFTMVDLYLQHNSDKTIDDFRNLIMSKIEKPDNFDDYAHYIVTINFGSNLIGVQWLVSDNFNFGLDNSTPFIMTTGNSMYCTYSNYLYFNSDYTDLNFRTPNTMNCSSSTSTGWSALYNPLGYMVLSSDLNALEYKSPTWSQTDVTFGNTTYQFGASIPLDDFNLNYNLVVDDYYYQPSEPLCSATQFLGYLSDVNTFTFNVKGMSNALNKPLRGILRIYTGSEYFNVNDWNVSYIYNLPSSEIFGDWDLTWNNSNNGYFTFAYNYIDDIDEELDLNFTFSTVNGIDMPKNIQLWVCSADNNYTSVSYSYNTNDSVNGSVSIPNTDNFLQDGSLPNISGLGDSTIIPDGPVDAILTLPLNVMNSLLNVLNSNTCQPLVLPLPFTNNQNLTLPCVSTLYAKINGLSTFLTWFSAIFSAFILYQYFINLYKWVDDTLTFRENNHFGGY